MHEQDSSGLPPSLLHVNKFKTTFLADGYKVENEESISDNDVDNIVGVTDSSELEVKALELQLLLFETCLQSSIGA